MIDSLNTTALNVYEEILSVKILEIRNGLTMRPRIQSINTSRNDLILRLHQQCAIC